MRQFALFFFVRTLELFGGKVLSLCVLAGAALPSYKADGSWPRAHLGSWPADATCQAHGIITYFSFHSAQSGLTTSCTVTVNIDLCARACVYLNSTPEQQQEQLLHLSKALF